MFNYNAAADVEAGEYDSVDGVGLRRDKKRAFAIAGVTSVALLLLFAFSGSSGSIEAAKAAAVAAPAQVAVQQPQPVQGSIEAAKAAAVAAPAEVVAVQQPEPVQDSIAAAAVAAPAEVVAVQQPEPEPVQVAASAETAAASPVEQVASAAAGPGSDAIVFSVAQYDLIYNVLSLAIACMGSATVFFFFQFSLVNKEYKVALTITGLVTLIAFYHYIRIFGSFTDAYVSQDGVITNTGIPFNDAYRYVDWLLTVPLLLSELILVMGLDADETRKRCLTLGGAAALMIILGYPGEITDVASVRWTFWALAMIPFLYIVYTLFFGLSASISKQGEAADLVRTACYVTVISWCFYPVVYIFPMLGLTGAGAHTAIQIGYSISDIVAKPLTGILVWMIAARKSAATCY